MKKNNGDNPMKNVHPYDVTAFYFANLKEEEMTDEEKLKAIKKRLESPKVYETGEESIWEDLKWTLDLVERLKLRITIRHKQFETDIGKMLKEREFLIKERHECIEKCNKSLDKIISLETILEKAEEIEKVAYWRPHAEASGRFKKLYKEYQQAIARYKKGEK